jgi:putative sigma-54 modulation protein
VDITVSSRNVEVSPALKAITIEKIGRLDRYVDGMDRADVHFAEERNKRIENKEVCEVSLFGGGHIVRAKVAAPDLFAAVDLAIEKLEHQLHKLKTRMVDQHHGRRVAANGHRSATALAEEADQAPEVVKTKRFRMKPMTVDEAVLQMELLNHAFYVFVRADSGEAAVLYHRDDGGVGLIEIDR